MRSTKALLLGLTLSALTSSSLFAGKVERYWYSGYPGTLIPQFTQVVPNLAANTNFNPALYFIDSQDGYDPAPFRYFTEALDQFGGDNDNNYGEFVRGYLEAPQTGNYLFWIASDDDGELWLSTDLLPANKKRIAFNNGAVGYQNWTAKTTQRSVTIPLVKGNKYYFEVYLKEGGGGDHVSVGWQLPDGTLNRPISGIYLAPYEIYYTGTIFGGQITLAGLTVASNTTLIKATAPVDGAPQSTNVAEHGSTFSLAATYQGQQPITYQWYRGATKLVGETLASLTFTNVEMATNGQSFRVAITNSFGGVLSAFATVGVNPDTNKPVLLSANSFGSLTNVTAVFSEPVSVASLNTNFYYLTNKTAQTKYKILAAQFFKDQKTVNLTTEAFPVVAGLYTLVVGGVQDVALVPNTIVTNSQANFNSVFADGLWTRWQFNDVGGGTVNATLTNSAKWTGRLPDVAWNTNTVESPSGIRDNYGQQWFGYFIPPSNGLYTFHIAADDQAFLLLSTDENPANVKMIAAEPVWANARQWGNGAVGAGVNTAVAPGTGNYVAISNIWGATMNAANFKISRPQTLVGNQRYYMEVRESEGGGGDFVGVGLEFPNDPALPDAAVGLTNNYGGQIVMSTTNAVGGVAATITAQPINLTTNDQQNARFVIGTTGTAPVTVQWYSSLNGSGTFLPFPDGTGTTLTTLPVTTNDNLSTFYAVVQNGFSSVTSSIVTLTVVPDITLPTLVRADGNARFNRVTVQFSERLNEVSATNLANYSFLPGLTVTNAILGPQRTNVVLFTAIQPPSTAYTITVNNVKDSSGNSNSIAPSSVIPYSSWVPVRGFAMAEQYNNIGNGTATTNLSTAGSYPENPDVVYYIAGGLTSPVNIADNFGVRISGTITPTNSSYYQFVTSSDDANTMYLSVNDTQAGLDPTPIALKTGANQAYSLGRFGQSFMTGNIPRYYELLMKEGGGGDYVRAAWLDAGNDPGFNTDSYVDALPVIQSQFLTAFANPLGAMINFAVAPPASITQAEQKGVTISLIATGAFTGQLGFGQTTVPISYIWQRKRTNDVDFVDYPVPTANGASNLVIQQLFMPQDGGGVQFRCLASVPGASAYSTTTTVTLTNDPTPPVLTRIQADASGTQVILRFSKPMVVTGPESFVFSPPLTVPFWTVKNTNEIWITTSAQTPYTRYQLSFTGVKDATFLGNTTVPSTVVTNFTSWKIAPGFIERLQFNGINNGDIPSLTNAAAFINNTPSVRYFTNFFEGGNGIADNYGTQYKGYILPPVDGSYRFYVASDDNSQLFLSTDSSPANRTLIALEPTWNNGRQWQPGNGQDGTRNIFSYSPYINPPVNRSEPVTLVGGQAYYVEYLHKEGGGGDNEAVTWFTPLDSAEPANNSLPITNQYLGVFVNPDDSIITISAQSGNTNVFEGRRPIFGVTASAQNFFGAATIFYQWQRGDGSGGFTNIVGATSPTYQIPAVSLADNNALLRNVLYMTNPIPVTNISTVVTMTVLTDTNVPVAVRVIRDAYRTNIIVQFNENITSASAQLVSNFSLTNLAGSVTINSAQLTGGSNLVLNTGLQMDTTNYTLVYSNIVDLAAAPNSSLATNQTITFNTFAMAKGYLIYERWDNIPANAGNGGNTSDLTNLLNLAAYQTNAATVRLYVTNGLAPATAAGVLGASGGLDNFGGRLVGYFIAPSNATYRFFSHADDGSMVRISGDDSPLNLTNIVAARNPSCCANYNASTNNSGGTFPQPPPGNGGMFPTVTLAAGERRYMEAVYKEGGGGDWMSIQVTNWFNGVFGSTNAPDGGTTTPAPNGNIMQPGLIAALADPDLATVTINTQPANAGLKTSGSTATFTVAATGSSPLSNAVVRFQWQTNGVNIANATNASYTTPALVQADSGNVYRALVYMPEKSVFSQTATLSIGDPPSITAPITPSPLVTNVGANVTLSQSASGTAPLSYQWRKNLAATGITTQNLTLNNVQYADQGVYAVVITNLYGSVTNGPASLQILVSPYQLTNSTFAAGTYGASFNTDAGRPYKVEVATSLSNTIPSGNWTLLTNVIGNGSPALITDPAATNTARFYRISTLFP